jgi:O-antigen/teichoic acid export membrane protein
VKFGRNLLAGLANSVWSAIIGLAVVPFYLQYLGIEAYGLIGFFVTTQALMSLLDMGLTPTINREVARFAAGGNIRAAGNLLHTLAIVYWITAAVIALLFVALAPLVAQHWLQSKQLSQQTILHSVTLLGLVVACRWPIGLYQGAMIGAQRLAVSSVINMVMVTIGSLGAVAVLAFVSSTIEAFFVWQASVGLGTAMVMRFAAWRVIQRPNPVKFDVSELRRIWRFTAGMSAIGFAGLLFSQLDKVVLSKILSLEEFGQFMLATAVVSGLTVLISPVYNLIYPRFSALVVTGRVDELSHLYRVGTRMLATVLFPAAMALAVLAEDIVTVWTGSPNLASTVSPVIALLTIGSALNGIMHFPYALQLASGETRLSLTIYAMLILATVPLTIFLAVTWGALGGATAWVILHVLYVSSGTWLMHRRLLKGMGGKWLLLDVGIPLLLSVLAGMVGYFLLRYVFNAAPLRLVGVATLACAASALSISMSPPLRSMALKSLGRTA